MKLLGNIRIFSIAVTLSFCKYAQAEHPDSIAGLSTADTIPAYLIPGGVIKPEINEIQIPPSIGVSSEIPALNPAEPMAMPSFQFSGLTSPTLFSWQGGQLSSVRGNIAMPGMMAIESGYLNMSHGVGPVTLSLWGGATKYGYFNGAQTSWGVGGALDYRINNHWSLTLFGEYYSPINAQTPGMAGYISTPRFGGYATYDINDHWGISVGAQAQRSVFSNSWEMQPIVMPYYRINKDVKLGIDVGGIMYHMIRDWANGRSGGVIGSPTIAPPRQGPPPVAPRR